MLVGRRGRRGVSLSELEVASGLDGPRLAAALAAAPPSELVRSGDWFVPEEAVAATADAFVGALRRFHAGHPLEAGMPAQAWRASAGELRKELVALAELRLERANAVVRDGATVRLPEWTPGGGETERRIRESILRALQAADAEPPDVAELEAAHPGADVAGALRLLAREGRAVAVGRDRYYEAEAFRRERDRLTAVLAELREATPGAIRERVGRSRKWLIPFLEQLDKEGVTERRGDVRALRAPRGS
jgi:selenocysteine-specific elongation factor